MSSPPSLRGCASALQETAEHEHKHEHADENASRNARHELDDAFERQSVAFGLDSFGPLDSDDIEWLQEQEAKRRALQKRMCRYCETTFHPVAPSVDECPSLARHAQRCRTATAAERAFYAQHRRWPRASQVDAGEEEAA